MKPRTGAKAETDRLNIDWRFVKATSLLNGLWENAVFVYEIARVVCALTFFISQVNFWSLWSRIDSLSREGSSTWKVPEGWETIQMSEVDKGSLLVVPPITTATLFRGLYPFFLPVMHTLAPSFLCAIPRN